MPPFAPQQSKLLFRAGWRTCAPGGHRLVFRSGVVPMPQASHPGCSHQRHEAFGGVPKSRPIGAGTGTRIRPQVRVAARVDLSPGWAKAGRQRPTMPDGDHSHGLGRRHAQPQAILRLAPVAGAAPPQSC
jgi:hypothetical protein